ncbi:unnamed protein product, partial [Closterium sp. NIES-54]
PVSLGERSRVRIPVYAHAGRCRCAEPVSLGDYGRTDPLLKQALLSQWSSGWDSDTHDPNTGGPSTIHGLPPHHVSRPILAEETIDTDDIPSPLAAVTTVLPSQPPSARDLTLALGLSISPQPIPQHAMPNTTKLLAFFARSPALRAPPDLWHKRLGHPSQEVINSCMHTEVFIPGTVLRPDATHVTVDNNCHTDCTIYTEATLNHKPFKLLGPGTNRPTRRPLRPTLRPCGPLAAPAAPLTTPCGQPAAPSPLAAPCCPLAACLRPARHPLAALVPASHPAFPPCCPTSRASPSLPAMTSLCRSGGSGEGSGGSSGSGGGRTSNLYGAVWWGVSGGGQMQLQWRQRESLPPQKLREWYASRTRGGSSSGSRCSAVQLGASGGGLAQLQRRPRETLTPQQLREWYAQRGASRSSARCPYVIRTGDRAGQTCGTGVDIFALDCDAILTAMYALTIGTEGDCYLCLLPDLGIEAAALSAPVSVRLADPSGCPVVACSSTVLPCPTVPSGSLSCLHLPSFSTNLVSTAALQDAMVTTTTPGGRRVSICTCTRTGRHLATFTHWPGSSLYTLATEPPQVAASAQVSASGQVAPPRSCRLLSHQTLLWHHRLGHPSLPHLRGMHSRLLVSGLPRSLPPLLPSPAPPCLPCVEGRQRATPHSSFPPTTAPLQTLHMDRFGQDLPVLRLHSEKGGEFSSNLLRDFCRWEGILQSFTLPDSPQQNGIAERRIGLFMEVARIV